MGDGLLEALDNLDGENVIEVLRIPVTGLGRTGAGDERARARVGTELDTRLLEAGRRRREELRRDASVNEQRLHGVAHAHPLRLRIERDRDRHLHVRTLVDVDVAQPLVVFEDGHRGALGDQPDELFPAPWNDEVKIAVEREHGEHGRTIRGVDVLDRFRRQPGFSAALARI
jgi:hypothetical protein